jgi:hypothetical protein
VAGVWGRRARQVEEGRRHVRPVRLDEGPAEDGVDVSGARDDSALGHLAAPRVLVEELLAARREQHIAHPVARVERARRPIGDDELAPSHDGHVESHHDGHELVADAVRRERREVHRRRRVASLQMPRVEPPCDLVVEAVIAYVDQPELTRGERGTALLDANSGTRGALTMPTLLRGAVDHG